MTEQTSRIIESHEIMQLLPHRYPFLLVDRVINFEEGKWLTAIKNISVNEPCFTGHFPGNPILPGVLILEAMAQAMGILAFKTHELAGGEIFPGDQMVLHVEVIKERRGITAFTATATVDGEVACEAKLMCARRVA